MSAETLIHRYLDDRASLAAEELDELIALLKAEPARAVALREQLILDDLVAQKLSVDRRNFPAQVGQRLADYHRGQEEMDSQVSDLRELAEAEIERPSTWSGSSPWVKYVALAATVLIAALIFVPRFLPQAPQAVAKVTFVQGEVQLAGGQPTAAAVGLAVMTGQQIVTPMGASLALEYADKTAIQIAGDSSMSIHKDETTGGKLITLDRGEIVATVVKQDPAGPLKITTPHAVATVVGTQFRLTVTDDATVLDVTEGTVLLDRLGGGQSITVAAKETGLASGELLQVKQIEWPEEPQHVAFLFSPFDFPGMRAPVSASRDSESGKLFDAELKPIGAATLNEFTTSVELSGGYLQSDDAGKDLLGLLQNQSELTLEIVLAAAQAKQSGPARIVALADDGRSANFALVQDGQEFVFQLRTSAGEEPQSLRFAANSSQQPVHLTLAYSDGSLSVYRDGIQVASSEAIHGTLDWNEGPLTLGADSAGHAAWRGTIEALAIHRRCLDPTEVARNAHTFRMLAGKGEK